MKKLLFLLLFATAMTQAQSNITLSAFQDVKLAFKGDSKGNDAFTTNIVLNATLNANQKGIGYGFLQPTFEYADLTGGKYYRYGINGGYTFNLNPIKVSLYAGAGAISREIGDGENTFYPAFAIGNQIDLKLFNGVYLSVLNQLTDRKDLKIMYDHKVYFNYSFYAGLTFEL